MSLAGRWKPHRRGYSIDQQKRPQSLCPWKICANTHSLFRPDRRHQSQCHNFLPTAARLLCSVCPNITGSTSWDVNGLGKAGVGYSSCGSSRISNNGAMSVSTGTYWACIGSSGADCGNNAVVNINAKNSNSVYGSSSVVQPSSTRLLMCIKS